jgi:hypothetical protein
VEEVMLKNFKTFDKKPLILFDKKTSQTDVTFKSRDGRDIKLSDPLFCSGTGFHHSGQRRENRRFLTFGLIWALTNT